MPSSINYVCIWVTALVQATSSDLDTMLILIGELITWVDFHISLSLIWALIWFTDLMFILVSIDLVLILSLILVPFWTLSNFWIACISWLEGSVSDHLTLPRSWRAYLILDVKRLSLIFRSNIIWKSSNDTYFNIIEL